MTEGGVRRQRPDGPRDGEPPLCLRHLPRKGGEKELRKGLIVEEAAECLLTTSVIPVLRCGYLAARGTKSQAQAELWERLGIRRSDRRCRTRRDSRGGARE